MKTKKSSGTIVFNDSFGDNYYLLLLYGGGHWDFPKGGVEEGESEIETALRELKEETSLQKVEIVDGFKRVISYSYKSDNEVVLKTVIFFLAHTSEFRVVLSKEHKAYAWMKFRDALAQLTFRTARQVLVDAENFLKNHPSFSGNKTDIRSMS